MNISVIIPTYNGKAYLPKLFDMLRRQTVAFELLIIDSSSSDGTRELIEKEASKVMTIDKSDFDHGATRTQAAKEAKGDILIFLTQDALPVTCDAFEKLLKSFKNPEVVAAYGRQLPHKDASLFAKHLRNFNYPKKSHIRSIEDSRKYGIKTAFFSDSFAAYRKDALEGVGWFKEGTIVGEDMHVVGRMLLNGGKIAYEADAQVYHSHNYSITQDFQRYFDTGVFHKRQSWLLESFGTVAGEGKKYVQSELNYLLKHGGYVKIPEFFIRNGAKLLGYKLGCIYNKLPVPVAIFLSMHKSWWKKWL